MIYGISNKRLCFVVPSYQRGYRWTKSQVNRLLTDLFDFRTEKEKGNKMVGDFYCLQPIVVKKDGKYGYINTKGKFVIEPVFESASNFNGNYAIVKGIGFKYWYGFKIENHFSFYVLSKWHR